MTLHLRFRFLSLCLWRFYKYLNGKNFLFDRFSTFFAYWLAIISSKKSISEIVEFKEPFLCLVFAS